MRFCPERHLLIGMICLLLLMGTANAGAQDNPAATDKPASGQSTSQPAESQATESDSADSGYHKPVLWKGLEIGAWGWLSALRDTPSPEPSYYVGEFSLNANQSFNGILALDAQVNFIDDNAKSRGEIEQAYLSALLSKSAGTILTVGKFNANIGAEPRDYWNRLTGTPSLLFGGQPQDFVGVMLTQPLGDTDVKLRPFVITDFEGHTEIRRPLTAGMTAEYAPTDQFDMAITGMVGPGYVIPPFPSPPPGMPAPIYTPPSSLYSVYGERVIGNWAGPDLDAQHGGTLYFLDARIRWMPCPDLTLAAEGLMATTSSSYGSFSWNGVMLLANYDITDQWRLFGRWSYLDDTNWIVTGLTQRRHELSIGMAYEFCKDVELRGEYRHDFSHEAGDLNIFSLNFSFGI